MKTLTFDIQEVGAQLRHAMSCTEWKQTYGETQQKAGLWWVKDEGTYLMSNGMGDDRPSPAYAKGLGADADWSAVQDICGGDDFAEFIDITEIPSAGLLLLDDTKGSVRIKFSATQMTISLHLAKQKVGA